MILVGLADAAAAAGVLPGTVRQWVLRGRIHPVGSQYDLEEIEEYCWQRDQTHAGRALSGRRRRGETRRQSCTT